MIFVVCITYCVCVLPITAINIADPENNYKYASVTFYCIYWLQYCCNNVIYVVSNSVYRQAYVIFLTEMFPPLKRVLHQPTPWQLHQSTVTTIAGVPLHSACSVADWLKKNDSLASQTATSSDSANRDGLPSPPSSLPSAHGE